MWIKNLNEEIADNRKNEENKEDPNQNQEKENKEKNIDIPKKIIKTMKSK